MDSAHIFLVTGWVIYCIFHSVLAGIRFKAKVQSYMGSKFKYYRLLYSLFALFTLVPLVYLQITMNSPLLFQPYTLVNFLAVFAGILGIIGLFLSLKKYIVSPEGFHDLFFEGMKPILQTNGLHARVRHPIYLFTFLVIWSVFLAKPLLSILLVNSVITLYTLIAIRFEERKLIGLYGKEYEDYRKRVPMLLPF